MRHYIVTRTDDNTYEVKIRLGNKTQFYMSGSKREVKKAIALSAYVLGQRPESVSTWIEPNYPTSGGMNNDRDYTGTFDSNGIYHSRKHRNSTNRAMDSVGYHAN